MGWLGQGCKLWEGPPDLAEVDLSKEQGSLVGKVRSKRWTHLWRDCGCFNTGI